MGFKLSQLNKKDQIRLCTFPQYAPVTVNPEDETGEDIRRRQEKFLKLPQSVREKLVSSKTSEIIQSIGKRYNLELLQMAAIARAIRSYYFQELNLKEIPQRLMQETNIDLFQAKQITQEIINKIIQKNVKTKKSAYIKSMSLKKALKEYENLGEQIITNDKIQVKPLAELVRPSIKNWIYDYHYHLGTGEHTVMERGNYLFHSENAKKLTDAERRRLAIILKSLDEDKSLEIDSKNGRIVFSQNEQDYDLSALKSNKKEFNSSKKQNKIRSISKKIKKVGDLFLSSKNTQKNNYLNNKVKQNKETDNQIIQSSDIKANKNFKKSIGSYNGIVKKTSEEKLNHPKHWLVGQESNTMFQSVFKDNNNQNKEMEDDDSETIQKISEIGNSKFRKEIKPSKDSKKRINEEQNYLKSRLYRIRPSSLKNKNNSEEDDIIKRAEKIINLKNKLN